MSFINTIKSKLTDRNYRYMSIVSEVTPVFSDRFGTTNKNNILLEKSDERVEFIELITQNNEPVEFHEGFDDLWVSKGKRYNHKGDSEFEVNKIKSDIIYQLDGTGYLENRNSLYKVILVTDKYVFVESLDSEGILIHSHEEIERFKEMSAFSIKRG